MGDSTTGDSTAVVSSIETATDNHDELPTAKHALTPPTSEDMDKRERSSSELSELMEDDDDEEIEPDHYFEGGKIPVFKPTMDQFRSFKKFIDKIDKYGMKSGIVKVIPPKEWRDSLPALDEAVKTIRVKNPITQEFAGQHGVYTQANIEKQRSYNLPEWKALTQEQHHQPPAKRGERRKAAPESASRARPTRAQPSASSNSNASESTPAQRRGPGRPKKRAVKQAEEDEEDADAMDVPPTPTSPDKEERGATPKIKKEKLEETAPKARGRQPKSKSISSRRMNNRTTVANEIDEEAFKDFDYHLDNIEEYTIERCRELEENYWRTINYGQPMYGADMPGSLFDDSTTSWNVANLENLLDVLGTKVPGVNTAYLYLGMWKATFAWHLEDVDLYSINYIHFGAPKQWYSISQEDARRFEAAMKSIWPQHAKNCSQFLRHKTYLISPSQLEKQFNIKVNKLVHNEGEFVITYPYGYHSGFNLGYNCAESVNFANEAWLDYGRIAKKCECESDSVWVDVNEIERKLRGEPTPEYIEETDDEDDDEEEQPHLPSPPQSVAGKSKSGRKRKRDTEKAAPQKKVKRVKLRLKAPPKEMPCILCPNDVVFDQLLPIDNGMKAHRLCAEYTPETYISNKPNDKICNVGNIDKGRLDLKCNYCRSKRGSVFQCSSKKCTRAFHATCAAAAGVQVDLGPMPTYDEEGTEYYYDGYDFRCKFHRPKKRNAKTVDSDYLEHDKLVRDHAKKLKTNDIVQFQYLASAGDSVLGGVVVENRFHEGTMLIDVLPDGDRIEVEWKYLLVLDPADSLRPKPSPNAKPLPEHIKSDDASLDMANRKDGVPEMGDPFHDPNSVEKWAEFNTAYEVKHPSQAKVDLSKENQLWYYLGKTSTEARAQYTQNLAIPKHNPKSNFLDTVKPAPVVPQAFPRQPYTNPYPVKAAKAANGSTPRTPAQQPPAKPYAYKPRYDAVTTFKQPSQTDAWKNPNSPVGHQPNVIYDHRASQPQYGYPAPYHNYRPQQHQSYHQHYAQSTGKPTNSSTHPGVEQYAGRSSSATQHSYYQTAPQKSPGYPPTHHYSVYSQSQQPTYSPPSRQPPTPQSQPPRSAAPIANMINGTSASPKSSSMYAIAPSPSVPTPHPPSQTSYLEYVQRYPYLKNAFLRRKKTYVSPYSPDGGFAPEWLPCPPSNNTPKPSSSSQDPHQRRPSSGVGLGVHFGSGHTLPPPRPSLQFQTEAQFQQDMARAPRPPMSSMSQFEMQLKGLATSTATPPPPTATPNGTTYHAPSHSHPIAPKTPTPVEKEGPVSEPLQRPIPSPLSDAPMSPKRPEYSPISDAGGNADKRPVLPSLQQGVPLGETWRYS